MSYERHHNIPICMQGIDHESNIIVLKKEKHKELHDILNIPYKCLRKFREKTNGMLVKDKKYIEELRKVHKEFFREDKLANLDENIIGLIANTLGNSAQYISQKYDTQRPNIDNGGNIHATGQNLYKYHKSLRLASKKLYGL